MIFYTSGGFRGGAQGTRAPRAPKFFRFHAVFGKIWQNCMLAPPLEKSWIRRCILRSTSTDREAKVMFGVCPAVSQADPPPPDPPSRDGQCRGRYASYWSAFLLIFVYRAPSVAKYGP